ncbi:hypothetical protein [Pectobacterium cacticida]|uniref:hypothetical protein n=1 Tax=Pectobacterium cacticida TaxID=69221 RepID=UPI00398840A0
MWGGKIINDDGTIWLSPDYIPINLWERGELIINLPFPNTFVSTVPINKTAVFFISQAGEGAVDARQVNVNGFHALRIMRATEHVNSIKIYCFANMAREPHDGGIRFYDNGGNITYSSEMIPLELHSHIVDRPQGTTTIDVGIRAAVLPNFSGTVSTFDSGLGVFRIFSIHAAAVGTSIATRLILLTGSASGPVAYTYTNQIYFIYVDKYD